MLGGPCLGLQTIGCYRWSLLYGHPLTVKRLQPGPPEDFQPIRNRSLNKKMNVRTSRETVMCFWLVSFDPKFLAVFENFARFLYGWNANAIDFTSTTRNYFRFGSKKFSCKTKKKEVSLYRKCLRVGKNHPGKRPGCYYVNKTSIQASLFGYTLF